jgi:hypothetical protein
VEQAPGSPASWLLLWWGQVGVHAFNVQAQGAGSQSRPEQNVWYISVGSTTSDLRNSTFQGWCPQSSQQSPASTLLAAGNPLLVHSTCVCCPLPCCCHPQVWNAYGDDWHERCDLRPLTRLTRLRQLRMVGMGSGAVSCSTALCCLFLQLGI